MNSYPIENTSGFIVCCVLGYVNIAIELTCFLALYVIKALRQPRFLKELVAP